MEFTAVAKNAVRLYSYQPGEEAKHLRDFPAVRTAEGCVWSNDGSLLGLENTASGGITVYNAAGEYETVCEVPPLVGGPVRNFYFSPLGTHVVTHERYAKDAGNNVGVWEVKTGELKTSFILKKMNEMSWPPMKWTSLEQYCCRMVNDGVMVMSGGMAKEEPTGKISAPGIIAFEAAPRGSGSSPPHVAVVIGESKGAPARCQIYKLTELTTPTASKTFFKAQSVSMQWNNIGTSVLIRTIMEVDDTGKSYYGGSYLHFLRSDGSESSIVASADDGPIHDVQWNPTQDEFCLLQGALPCNMTLHEGKKGQKRVDFGTGHRNTIRWNNFGRFLVLAGHGQLVGDTDFWDKPGKQLLGTTRMECCVVCSWAPDGRHFLGATTAPRMRVDNKVQLFDYGGKLLFSMPFDELLLACWRPRPRGAFEDRPPSPGRPATGAGGSAGQKGGAAAPKPQAYRPPGARGGGGLAETLRKELGSTAAAPTGTATKVGGKASGPVGRLPPGCSPEDFAQPSQASKAEKKKKAKANAAAAAEKAAAEAGEEPAPAKAPAKAVAAKAAPPKAAPAAPAPAVAAEGDGGNAEVEKKVRALRKKQREIEKLKEKPDAELDPLQRQKIAGLDDILSQIRSLGAEP